MTLVPATLFAEPNRDRPCAAPAAPADPRRPRVVSIHYTPFTPRIPATAGLAAPCRWATLYGATADQALRHLLERLDLKPWDLSLRANPAGELIAYVGDPDQPLAIITEGLTLDEARTAQGQLRRDWSRS